MTTINTHHYAAVDKLPAALSQAHGLYLLHVSSQEPQSQVSGVAVTRVGRILMRRLSSLPSVVLLLTVVL